ncbi:MAG: hypothetical protein R3C68_03975 [Myxococcota bacterium]
MDIKQAGNSFCVMEINDNPSIDAGYEDMILKDKLYDQIMEVFFKRLEARRGNVSR